MKSATNFSAFISFCLVLFCIKAQGAGLFTDLSINEKSALSQYVIEGQVLSQESFWDKNDNQILTSYEVLVYKSFKDEIQSDHIYIIVDGGALGDEMHRVFPSFNTNIGEVGLFFLKENPSDKEWNGQDTNLQYRLISNNQGNVKYDLKNLRAADHTNVYSNIETELYNVITEESSQDYTVWNKLAFQSAQEETENVLKMGDPSIECVYPNVIIGGNNSVLTITGEGFGSLGSNSQVRMSDPNTGGLTKRAIKTEHVLFWDDNTIEVIVPDDVGTGSVVVQSNTGESVETEIEVFVKYSVNTAGTEETPSMLINQNGEGGYTFTYSTSTSNGGDSFAGSSAVAPFERALDRLQAEVGFNAMATETANINTVSNDGFNMVMYDNNIDPLSAAGLLHAQYSRCGGMWEVVGMDIIFRRDGSGSPTVNWNYTTDAPAWNQLDFESVAIHELIHGLQIKHNMQQASLMYFAYSFGSQKRLLNDCYDKRAIQIVNDRSQEYNPYCNGANSYELHSAFQGYNFNETSCIVETECGTSAAAALGGTRVKATALLEGFISNSGTMTNMLSYNNLLPYAQPFNQDPWNYNGSEVVINSFPTNTTDWVLISLHDANNPVQTVAQKAALMDINGNIRDIEGNEGIPFPEVQSGSYYISIRHCSHLGIMSTTPVDVPNAEPYDFTQAEDLAMGYGQQVYKHGKYVLVSGDYDGNGIINNLDFNKWHLENALVNEYVTWDGDGNGVVNNLDFNLWAANRSKIGIGYLQK